MHESVTTPSPTPRTPAGAVAGASAVLAVAAIAQLMLMVDDTIVNVALPDIASDFGLAAADLTWVANAYLLTFGGFLLVGGRLADRIGRRRTFLWSLVAFGLTSALCGVAPSSEVLWIARGLQGVSAAVLSPAALVLAAHPEGAARTRALAVWAGLMGLGAALGLILGGVLVELAGWRWIFYINLPIAAVALAVAPRLLPADPERTHEPLPDLAGATAATLGLLLLVFTVLETDDEGWGSARTLGGLAAVALLAALFAARQRTARVPVVARALLARRRAMAGNGTVLLVAAGLLAMFFFLTLYMQRVNDFTALETGLSYLPFSLSLGLASGIADKAGARVPALALILAGAVLAAIGLLMMGGLEPGDAYASTLLPALVVAGLGLGLTLAPAIELATSGAAETDYSQASSLMTTAQQIGGALGIAVLVTIVTASAEGLDGATPPVEVFNDALQEAFRIAAALVLAGGLLSLLAGRGPARAD